MACFRRPLASRGDGGGGVAQRGFVLAVTLWLLAGIAVVVGLVTVWSLDEVRDAARDRASVDDLLAIQGTRDALIYLGLTRPMTRAGLPTRELDKAERASRLLQEFGGMDFNPRGSELRLDGTQYNGLPDTRFAVQDEAGLYPLTLPAPYSLDRFLAEQGIKREGIANLRDSLLDYIDADDLRLLQGAETREYHEADLPPPPNRRLRLPDELHRVLGWNRLPEALRQHLAEVATVYYVGGLNLNTAPAALLPAFLSGCPQTCEAFQARRAQKPFQSSREVETLLGVRLPGDSMTEYRFAPSQNLRITLWGRTGAAIRIHVELAPLTDQHAPWYVLAAYPVPRPPSNAPAQSTDSALLADPPAG
ncbi:MAG: hypothetical protein ACOH1L_11065 [Thermomonas sp.]